MSVLIKNMEMPKSCFGCHLFNLDDQDLWCIANHYAGCCRVLSEYIDENKFVNERHPDCPLIEIPTPHGRLGDLDELIEKYGEWYTEEGPEIGYIGTMKSLLKGASTVIEAED